MSGNSSVGTAEVYEAGDQRNQKDEDKSDVQATPYDEGKPNSHKDNDPSKFRTSFFTLVPSPRAIQEDNDEARQDWSTQDSPPVVSISLSLPTPPLLCVTEF